MRRESFKFPTTKEFLILVLFKRKMENAKSIYYLDVTEYISKSDLRFLFLNAYVSTIWKFY